MTLINKVIINKQTAKKPIWIMRQAGRYLPEFREIRNRNKDFIKLCLNEKLSTEITLQPLKRFDLDAAIIFSDILMVPHGLNQKVEFKKGFGPILDEIRINEMSTLNEEKFTKKLSPIYKILSLVKSNSVTKNKNIIGFIGAPWTLLVYMINKQSPKLKLKNNFLNDIATNKKILSLLDKFLKIHIKNQIKHGANIIQIFDSWAGLLSEKELKDYVYDPTIKLVEYTKSLNVPVICFPRNIKNYKKFCEIVRPDVISIDYNIDPNLIVKDIKIPVQGGMNPEILLSDKETLKKEAKRYMDIFKDHPYIFNLGHGVLPETNPDMMNYLIKTVKDY
tara:strand:- start:1288 stop:2289 length:1002 start_codon:yes stop_codon:yes gene_type:complete